ncbi:MAG: spondin domain-containing protein [Colwellia sp.]|nr:spondin domain-containing protein [Colwellia sp.]
MKNAKITSALVIGAALLLASSITSAAEIQVKLTNNASANGTYLTPVWAGFHDGSFDIFDRGGIASPGLESIAEDGRSGTLSSSFNASTTNGVDGVVGMGPIAPSGTVSNTFTVSDSGSNNYFSYASMLLPSSDFFIANGDPLAFSIASLLDGSESVLTIEVFNVYDAGTEVNDFATSAGNGLFGITGLGQMGPNQGVNENGMVTLVGDLGLAFIAFGSADGIDTSRFNFARGASIATIELTNVSAVPVPAAAFMFAPALLGFLGLRRKAKNSVA